MGHPSCRMSHGSEHGALSRLPCMLKGTSSLPINTASFVRVWPSSMHHEPVLADAGLSNHNMLRRLCRLCFVDLCVSVALFQDLMFCTQPHSFSEHLRGDLSSYQVFKRASPSVLRRSVGIEQHGHSLSGPSSILVMASRMKDLLQLTTTQIRTNTHLSTSLTFFLTCWAVSCGLAILFLWLYDRTDIPLIEHIPSVPGFPLLGNLIQLGNEHPRRLAELSKQYGPVFQIRLGNKVQRPFNGE